MIIPGKQRTEKDLLTQIQSSLIGESVRNRRVQYLEMWDKQIRYDKYRMILAGHSEHFDMKHISLLKQI